MIRIRVGEREGERERETERKRRRQRERDTNRDKVMQGKEGKAHVRERRRSSVSSAF